MSAPVRHRKPLSIKIKVSCVTRYYPTHHVYRRIPLYANALPRMRKAMAKPYATRMPPIRDANTPA